MKEKQCLVYILKCRDKSLYTGYTNDLPQRLTLHASGKGSKFVRSRLPFTAVYIEACPDKSTALKREYEIKQMTRAQKCQLIDKSRIKAVSEVTKKRCKPQRRST